jgi:hypothetical protein
MKYRGFIVGAASGALGSAVASHNKGGQYLRARVVPSGAVPTTFQGVIRNAIRSVTNLWQSLSDGKRATWNVYAANVFTIDALGQSIQLSGFNWFTGYNVLASQIGLPVLVDGPTTFDRGGVDLSGVTFEAIGTSGTLSFPTSPSLLGLSAGDAIPVYVGRDYSPGRAKYFGSFQLTEIIGGDATQSDFPMTLPFAHDSNNKMDCNVLIVRGDGRYTTPSRFTVSL